MHAIAVVILTAVEVLSFLLDKTNRMKHFVKTTDEVTVFLLIFHQKFTGTLNSMLLHMKKKKVYLRHEVNIEHSQDHRNQKH